ncbi:MAG: ATP-binding region ATPase domain protein [Gemmatimonadetes bacterium]|nr:ATP-binding region ATPase domain protein [Gemmatimonadota bacterium]
MWRSLPLERKLPALLSLILILTIAVSLAVMGRTLSASQRSAARERTSQAARQLAATVNYGTAQRLQLLRRLVRDSSLARALHASDSGRAIDSALSRSVQLTLKKFIVIPDTLARVELWDRDGKPLVTIGPPPRSDARAWAPGRDAFAPSAAGDVRLRTPRDTVINGPFFGEGKAVRYWVTAPVIEGAALTGFVATEREIPRDPQGAGALRALVGNDLDIFFRNADGSFWSTVTGDPTSAVSEAFKDADGPVATREGRGHVLLNEAPLAGTPWMITVEAPLDSVYARTRKTITRMGMFSLLLIITGAAAAWLIGRRMVGPIGSLTTAAESIARGEDVVAVHGRGDDEVGRLAASFNQMATEVVASRRTQEHRVAEATRAAGQLEEANRQLHQAMLEADVARQDAERANRAKSDFLAVMSHELRTPLNAIGGYAQLLEIGIYGPIAETQRDALTRIARSQTHLLRLINDVLNFAKLDAGQVEYALTDVPVHETVHEMETLVAPQVRMKGIQLHTEEIDVRITARADREKLQQILLNLLTNAIKFTPSGGSVTVGAVALGDRIQLTVRDTGPGIPAERLETIFDPFVQGDRALNRPNEGVGLGLTISRDLARGMGGEIVARAAGEPGAIFDVSLGRGLDLPLVRTEQAARPA